MKIHELEQRAEELQTRISEISAISEKSSGDIQEWRDLKLELAMVEDSIDTLKSNAEYLLTQSNLGKRFRTRTFENFDTSINGTACEVCKVYVDGRIYDTEKCGLIICGNYGTGKTHLAAAIANSMIDMSIPVLFDTYGGHLEKLKAEFNSNNTPRYLNLMRNVSMLILDDVGKEKQTEWSQSVMFDIINYRYESMKPIVITSNFSRVELQRYFGNACYSRLIEMCHALVTKGDDYRIHGSQLMSL